MNIQRGGKQLIKNIGLIRDKMISRGKLRFMRWCSKCGVLFRPLGRTTSVCPSCKIKIEIMRNEKVNIKKRNGDFYRSLRWRLDKLRNGR